MSELVNPTVNTRPIALEIENLVVGVGKSGTGKKIIDGISLQVRQGETLCVVGESGSGKSVTSLSTMGSAAARFTQSHRRQH